MGQIIAIIVTGAIIGALARLFKPGQQDIGILWTIILGAIGSALGNVVLSIFNYSNDNGGVAWLRWIVSIAIADRKSVV